MARYIKANPKVAQFLRLDNDRNQIKDGNYLLWQSDMLAFGRLTELPQILEQCFTGSRSPTRAGRYGS